MKSPAPATATALANANIALIKYWGKRALRHNLPAAGSISLALEALKTTTTITLRAEYAADTMTLDGRAATSGEVAGVTQCLNLLRAHALRSGDAEAQARAAWGAHIVTANDFATASGLASSASGYAALVVAGAAALGLSLSNRELSQLAREGSGSAARSIFGGLVRLHAGVRDDGADCYAEPMANAAFANSLAMVIAEVGGGKKKAHASRDAMEHCRLTSPYYAAWLQTVARDLAAAEAAIAAGDLPTLGALCEANAMAMHATIMASRPAIVYWQPATLAIVGEVAAMRHAGLSAWATMDAGPHVKVLTTPADAPRVAEALRGTQDVSAVTISAVGHAAAVLA